MHPLNSDSIHFGPCELRSDGRLRLNDQRVEQLPRRLHLLLKALIEARGHTVSKDALLRYCWPNTDSSEQGLARAIADLRRKLESSGEVAIKTVYGVGYRLEVSGKEPAVIGRADGSSYRQAETLHQEALSRIHLRRPMSLNLAEKLLEQASGLRAEPRDHIAIAELYVHRIQLGYNSTVDAWPALRSAAETAADERPAQSLSFRALGLCWAEWDFSGADQLIERARQIDPTGYAVNRAAGLKEQMVGNGDLAKHWFRMALEANPMALATSASLVLTLAAEGRRDEAFAEIADMDSKDPDSSLALAFRALVETRFGDASLAVDPAKRSFDELPESPLFAALLAYALAGAGDRTGALGLLERPAIDGEIFGNSCAFACWAWLSLDLPNRAMETLQRSFARRCPHLPLILRDPAMAPLVKDERFSSIFSTVFHDVGTSASAAGHSSWRSGSRQLPR